MLSCLSVKNSIFGDLNTTLCIGSMPTEEQIKEDIAKFKYNTLYRFNLQDELKRRGIVAI